MDLVSPSRCKVKSKIILKFSYYQIKSNINIRCQVKLMSIFNSIDNRSQILDVRQINIRCNKKQN